jgi:hypothetical protein
VLFDERGGLVRAIVFRQQGLFVNGDMHGAKRPVLSIGAEKESDRRLATQAAFALVHRKVTDRMWANWNGDVELLRHSEATAALF